MTLYRIASKVIPYKENIHMVEYKVCHVFYKCFLFYRISDYYSSYSQAEQAPIKIFNKL